MKGLDPTVIGTWLVAALLAFNQFRLTRENKRKVLAEGSREAAQGSDLITQGADRLVKRWEEDNRRLRERVEKLEDRTDLLEGLLRQHGVAVPID